jgi:enoyl-CoA hydratase
VSKYSEYRYLRISVSEGIARVEISHPTYDARGHWEIAQVWLDLDADPDVRVALLTWADPPDAEPLSLYRTPPVDAPPAERFAVFQQRVKEARDIVYNIMNMNKLVVSAIRGPGVSWGSGLACSLLADISIASESVQFSDDHIVAGEAAGDQAVLWALFCGLQKAKWYALTCDVLTGREAERIGLVSRAVPDGNVMTTATDLARSFSNGPQHALHFTKRAFNQWLRLGVTTSFELGLALEMQNLYGVDPDWAAAREKGRVGPGEPRVPGWEPAYPSVTHPYQPPS